MVVKQRRPAGAGFWIGIRVLYAALAIAAVLLIVMQVFLAGMNVFVGPRYWGSHVVLGHAIGGLFLALLALGFAARLTRGTLVLNAALILLFALQYNHRALAALVGIPELAAIHAANALLLFAGAALLAQRSWRSLQNKNMPTG